MSSENYLFFFAALGVFNGVLLAVYLFFLRRPRSRADYRLGGLVLMLVLRVGISCGYYFEGRISWSIVQLGLSAHLMTGPFLLAYLAWEIPAGSKVKAFTDRLLVGQLLTLLVFGAFWPFVDHLLLWDFYLRYTFHVLLLGYLLVAGGMLYRLYPNEVRAREEVPLRGYRPWLVYTTVLAICGGFAISLYVNYVLGPIIATAIFYLSAGAVWWLVSTTTEKKPLATPLASNTVRDGIAESLRQLMEEEKLHTQPTLRLADLASALRLPPKTVSRYLNDQLGKTFHQYLTDHRVAEAQHLLCERQELTMEAIGYEAGFNSRSTFFAVFRERTGQSPRAYQEHCPEKSENGFSDS